MLGGPVCFQFVKLMRIMRGEMVDVCARVLDKWTVIISLSGGKQLHVQYCSARSRM